MKKIGNKLSLNFEDIGQLIIGAFSLAVPISFSEESWKLGEKLPTINLILLFILSIGFLSLFAYQSMFQRNVLERVTVFIFRVFIAYLITIIVVSLVLISIDKFPLFANTIIAMKRAIVISMPASIGAIIVDSFDKE